MSESYTVTRLSKDVALERRPDRRPPHTSNAGVAVEDIRRLAGMNEPTSVL